MNASVISRASSSGRWFIGDFIRYELGPSSWPREPVVERQLAAADGVDHDPGRVRRIPHLELQLSGQRYVTERLTLEPDVRPFAVGQPRHVVRRADMDVLGGQRVAHDRGHGVRLRDLLRLEPLALEHVVEVHVAADVQLRGAQQLHAAIVEQSRQRAVHDRRADLRLDVVADDRHSGLLEALVPVLLASDEHRDAVDESRSRPRGSARRTTWSPARSRPAGRRRRRRCASP